MHSRRVASDAGPSCPALALPLLLIFLLQSYSMYRVVELDPPAPQRLDAAGGELFDASQLGEVGQWATELERHRRPGGEHSDDGKPVMAESHVVAEAPTTTEVSKPVAEEKATTALTPRLEAKATRRPTTKPTPLPRTPVPSTPAPPTPAPPTTQPKATLADSTMAPTRLEALKNAALLVLCYNRPKLLSKSLARITAAALSKDIKKYISQDGDELETQAVAKSFDDAFEYMSHPRTLPSVLSLNSSAPDRQTKDTPGTMYLAAHYKWALDKVLLERNHTHAIIVEDDLSVSHDFFAFFEQMAPVLAADPTLWCVSSWNDNGFGARLDVPRDQVFRSSYFPGLGWMLRREVWLELSPKFPYDNWDHWMRVSSQHRGRACLVPFLSRNRNMGDQGATASTDFFERYLKQVSSLKDKDVKAHGVPVIRNRNGLLEAAYDRELRAAVLSATEVDAARVSLSPATFPSGGRYVVPYVSEDYEALATLLQLHSAPRTAYKGVTWLRFNRADIFLVNRRLSPFVAERFAVRKHPSLMAIRASQPNQNCIDACRVYGMGFGETWTCGDDQFDYINDCAELEKHFDRCPYGCTQGWGEEIPNMETWDIGFPPMCLTTEMKPRCAAKHPLTTRLCPCINAAAARGGNAARVRHPKLRAVAAAVPDESCNQVCAAAKLGHAKEPLMRCDDTQFEFISTCMILKSNFPCTECAVNSGSDLPNFVQRQGDPNDGKCLVPSASPTCWGSHAASRRLCPCVPIPGADRD